MPSLRFRARILRRKSWSNSKLFPWLSFFGILCARLIFLGVVNQPEEKEGRQKTVMKKIALVATNLALAALVTLALALPNANAAKKKVDCDQVMSELNAGKKPKEVAKDLSISTSSVYRCRKKASAAAKTSTTGGASATTGAAAASPAASPGMTSKTH
jgi:hypothetical protein